MLKVEGTVISHREAGYQSTYTAIFLDLINIAQQINTLVSEQHIMKEVLKQSIGGHAHLEVSRGLNTHQCASAFFVNLKIGKSSES